MLLLTCSNAESHRSFDATVYIATLTKTRGRNNCGKMSITLEICTVLTVRMKNTINSQTTTKMILK